jgi:hypothetical protein
MDKKLKSKKKPWPTKKAMEQVYEMNLWGGKEFDFYSGEGSHNLELVTPYITIIKEFLLSFKTPITVCDLGCGDFNIGKKLVAHTEKYIAVDIVEKLIERNKKLFIIDNLQFHCLDISKDKLPKADCVILRQVLQHLSNDEIQNVLNRVKVFKYLILTEHIPEKKFIPNKDIISGQGIRLKSQSGIDITKAPFNLIVKEEKQLLSLKLNNGEGVIKTTLFTIF